MKHYTYKPQGTCSTQIEFDLDGHTLHNVHFTNGCPGNLLAISKLLEGADAQKTVDILKGNTCGMKNTSCADQLAKGIAAALQSE
ncbi:MAG: TIGR03905 family TSCPD domain-containing protein [Absicoccus sp.]|jgi:uncharacterized protein (TIGR03905 family)|uniref:ribonucleoside-diphosphate reductase n=2 Tax=Absicoccus TaxID=2718525 RepID=A0A3N0HXC7_9FIRM|nr:MULTISPECIES: TIGR03905 family TSCPD domain-containing protein [Absicoccus]MCI6088870.1 TIGR03905 family TSCPD domain-containing protein [Absicoccus porci]MDD6460510.1 TIGR03905 family TSCPD domain-containing protein [Absicoccus porci]MDD7331167.1 TIGR03905 family TSCPD domain-containing protein [Absicoccus porci]MDX8417231.1 TIGR03905 family TSCPD domain-containing protein [Absicoccus sp. CLA-KB-P134]MDY3036284.1 TIGR03905 family TSCPD domain-containing protein [Absicoccus sp.]